tara:strand:+ start:155 stop:337 length:183 start_codon:yes stop_codon:yes gene_type:complete
VEEITEMVVSAKRDAERKTSDMKYLLHFMILKFTESTHKIFAEVFSFYLLFDLLNKRYQG